MASKTVSLAATIVLGIISIALFMASLILGFVSVVVTRRGDPAHAVYIMTVATILGILVPFTFTALTKYLVDYLVLNADESVQRETYTLLSQEESAFFTIDLQPTTTTIPSTSTVSIRRLLIFDHIITGVYTQEFQTTTTPVLMLLLVGQAALMCGIMSFMWSVFISNHFMEKPLASSLPYLLVEVLGGLISPISLCAGAAMLAIAIHFISSGQIDLRAAMAHVNPAIVYTCGFDVTDSTDTSTTPAYFFWIISNHFYAQVSHGHSTQKDQLYSYVDPTPSTWVITGTVVLSLLSAMLYFVNTVLLESYIIEVPPKMGQCDGANCFTNWNTELVDCTDNSTYIGKSYMHCYSFTSNPNQSLWAAISIAFGVYGATIVVFRFLFAIAAMLHNLYHTRAWGVLYLLVGVLGIVYTILFYFIPRLGAFHLDEAKAAYLIILSVYAILSGVLLFLGGVQELIKDTTKVKSLLFQ